MVTRKDLKETSIRKDLKEVVSESLLEALIAAEEAQNRKKGTFKGILSMVGSFIPTATLAVLGWMLLSIIDVQKEIVAIQRDIVSLRVSVSQTTENIAAHDQKIMDRAAMNSIIHHVDQHPPCNSCHVQFYKKIIIPDDKSGRSNK